MQRNSDRDIWQRVEEYHRGKVYGCIQIRFMLGASQGIEGGVHPPLPGQGFHVQTGQEPKPVNVKDIISVLFNTLDAYRVNCTFFLWCRTGDFEGLRIELRLPPDSLKNSLDECKKVRGAKAQIEKSIASLPIASTHRVINPKTGESTVVHPICVDRERIDVWVLGNRQDIQAARFEDSVSASKVVC